MRSPLQTKYPTRRMQNKRYPYFNIIFSNRLRLKP